MAINNELDKFPFHPYLNVDMDKINNMNLNDLESICSNLEKDFDDFWNYNILKNELQNPNSIYFVAKDKNNNILGFAGILKILDEADITNIVVKKDYRNKGIG